MFNVCIQTWVQSGLVFILNDVGQNDFTDVDILWNCLCSTEEQDLTVCPRCQRLLLSFLLMCIKFLSNNLYIPLHCQSPNLFSAFNFTLSSSSIYSDLKKKHCEHFSAHNPFNDISLPSARRPTSLTSIRSLLSALAQPIYQQIWKKASWKGSTSSS